MLYGSLVSNAPEDEVLGQYSAAVLDHARSPRNLGPMDKPDGHARITGPCGDTVEIFVRVVCERIAEAGFLFEGCLTTMVSASAAVELLTGRPVSRAVAISQQEILDALDGLPRHNEHCALLAANAARAAITDFVSTRNEPWKRLYR
jgi:nitrogen fixation NifU-like protein